MSFSFSRTPSIYMYVFLIACRLESHSTIIHLSRVYSRNGRWRVEEEGGTFAQEEGERRKCVLRISWDDFVRPDDLHYALISVEMIPGKNSFIRGNISTTCLSFIKTRRINHIITCRLYRFHCTIFRRIRCQIRYLMQVRVTNRWMICLDRHVKRSPRTIDEDAKNRCQQTAGLDS